MITSYLTQCIYQHYDQNDIIAPQQKRCATCTMGSKEPLIIDSVVCIAYQEKKVLTAYIDYKKAFIAIPHEWFLVY